MIKQNQYVRAKANTIIDDINLVNKFVQSKSHEWISKWEEDYEKDYGEPYAPQDEDLIAKKELKKQKAINELKHFNKKKVERIQLENTEAIEPKIPEKTVTDIVKEMSEKKRLNEIESYEKEFGRDGIVKLMRPV